jgi:hypothetical protein
MRNAIVLLASMLLIIGLCIADSKKQANSKQEEDEDDEDTNHPHKKLYFSLSSENEVVVIDIGNQPVTNQTFAKLESNNQSNPNTISKSPKGLFFKGNDLTVAFEIGDNATANGAILQFNKKTGEFKRYLVPHSDPEAPFRPHGAIWIPGNLLVVADNGFQSRIRPALRHPGYIRIYDYSTGAFLRKFNASADIQPFQPTGIVYLNGKLYVTSFSGTGFPGASNVGYLSRFDLNTGFEKLLASSFPNTSSPHLHHPQGMAVGPDGNFWIPCRASNQIENDFGRILVVNENGETMKEIPMSRTAEDAKAPKSIVFGPDNELYMSLINHLNYAEIWKYNLETKEFKFVFTALTESLVESISSLVFRKTDPSSLKYRA